MEKYKFTSVVAQDLLDSFLSFFPELKEQSVDCRAGEARRRPRVRDLWPSAPGGAAAVHWGEGCSVAASAPGKGPWLSPPSSSQP